MITDLIKYEDDLPLSPQVAGSLADLSGTMDDIGHAMAQLSRLTDIMVPIAENIQKITNDPTAILDNWLKENPAVKYGLLAGSGFLGLYLASGVVRNVCEIYKASK